jgi:uncharacterized protein (DUF433 family)
VFNSSPRDGWNCFLPFAGLQSHLSRGLVMATAKPPLITSTPDILGGTPVFSGTRVPVQTLIEYLEGGQSIDEFLDGFPTVSREQVIAFLEEAKARMLAVAS